MAKKQVTTKKSKKEAQDVVQEVKTESVETDSKPVQNSLSPEMEKLKFILDNLDKFIDELVKDESKGKIEPQDITEALIQKARHNAFFYSRNLDECNVLVWMINILLCNAKQVYEIVRQQYSEAQKANDTREALPH